MDRESSRRQRAEARDGEIAQYSDLCHHLSIAHADAYHAMKLSSLASFSSLALAFAFSSSWTVARASVGDRSRAYRDCVETCSALKRCDPDSRPSSSSPSSFPPGAFAPYKTSPLWGCRSTCSYACQQLLTDLSLSLSLSSTTTATTELDLDLDQVLEGLPRGHQVQFHGKWPFHRLDLSSWPFPLYLVDWFVPRAQEPLSVAFSILNLIAHYRGFVQLSHLSRSSQRGRTEGGGGGGSRTVEGRALARVYLVYALTGLNAWASSAIFHTRDTNQTEKLDYFGAGLTTWCGLWICITRILGWYHDDARSSSPTEGTGPVARGAGGGTGGQRRRLGGKRKRLLTIAFVSLYLAHVAYLSLRRNGFDYSYNMKANVIASLATIALWLYWMFGIQSTLPTPSNFSRRQLSAYPSARARFRAPHHLDPLVPLLALPVLSVLEVFDFAPVGFGTGARLLDSHALWHLSTVWVVRRWYDFLTRDVRWIDGQGDPPTAANAVQGSDSRRAKDTPVATTGRFGSVDDRRGNLKEGMVGFGLGILDKYGLGLGGFKRGGLGARAAGPGARLQQSNSAPSQPLPTGGSLTREEGS